MITLVSDFDNTFYTLHYLDNITSIHEFVKEGNYFFLTSERNYVQLISEIKNFNIPYAFLICDDGALIYDFYGEKIYHKPLSQEIIKNIFKELEKTHQFYEIWYDNGEDYTLDCDGDIYKLIAKPKEYDHIEEYMIKLQEKFPMIRVQMIDNWLHIMDKEISKASAIRELIKRYELDEKRIYTVGDDLNDLSMIKEFKGFVMQDGKEEVKKYAIKEVQNMDEIIKYIKEDSK